MEYNVCKSGINFRHEYTCEGVLLERLTADKTSYGQERPKDHLAELKVLADLPASEFEDIEQPGAAHYRDDRAEERLRTVERSAKKNYAASYITKLVDERFGVVPIGVFSLMYPDPQNLGQKIVARLYPRQNDTRDTAGYIRNEYVDLAGSDPASTAKRVLSSGLWLAAASGVKQIDVVVANRLLETPVRSQLTVVEAFAPQVDGFTEMIDEPYQSTEGQSWGGPDHTGYTYQL